LELDPTLAWITDPARREQLLRSMVEAAGLLGSFLDTEIDPRKLDYSGAEVSWKYRHSDFIRLRICPDAPIPIQYEGFERNYPLADAGEIPEYLPEREVKAFLDAIRYEDEWGLVGDLDHPVALQAEAEGSLKLNTDPDSNSTYWELA